MDASLARRTETERARAAPAPAPRAGERRRSPGLLTVAAVVAVAVGVALRFWTSSHLWLDEALTVNIARLPLSRLPDALRHDGSPPLYYLLLHGWTAVFGSSDVAVRALSGLFAVASLPLIWMGARRLGGRRAATAALLLLASSPFAIRFATEARMYSLLGFLALVGFLVLRRQLARPSVVAPLALAVISGLLLLTHYWSIYLVATVCVLLAGRWRSRRDRASLGALAGVAGGAVLFAPWLPDFAYQLAHTGTPWAGRPTLGVVIDTIRAWAGGGSDAGQVLNLVLLALAALALWGAAIDGRRIELELRTRPGIRRVVVACFGTLVLALLAGAAFASAYVVRYTAVVFPLFVLVVAFGSLVFVDDRVRWSVLGLAVILGLVAAAPNIGGRRTEATVVAHALNRSVRPGDVVAYCPDQLGPSVSRLVTVPVVQLTFPTGAGPEFVDWVDYAARNKASRTAPFAHMLDARAGTHRLWLVWSPGYRTFGSKCSTLTDRLELLRPRMKRVVKVSVKYEERIGLIRYEHG